MAASFRINDVELVKKARAGDQRALAVLVRKYQGAVYALVLNQVRNAAAAEDISQDVFVTAYLKLNQLKNLNRFGAWLRSITVRTCAMWLRSEKRYAAARMLSEAMNGMRTS